MNSTSTLTIPAGTTGVDIYYKFPASGTSVSFKVLSSTSLTPSPDPLAIILRDPMSNYRWLSAEYSHRIYKDKCYPVLLRAYDYSGSASPDDGTGVLTFTPSKPQLKFYDTSGCSGTAVTTFTFAPTANFINAYIKYVSDGSETTSYTSISISGVNAGTFSYDYTPPTISVDLTSESTPQKVEIYAPYNITRNTCTFLQLTAVNKNGTPIPVSVAETINLGTVESSVGSFYYNSNCGTTISSSYISSGSAQNGVYFKATTPVSGKYTFYPQPTTLESIKSNFYVTAPAEITFPATVSNIDIVSPDTASACKDITISNAGGETSGPVAVGNLAGDFTFTGCTSTCAGGSLPAGSSCTISVRSTAEVNKSLSGTLTVLLNGISTGSPIALSGTASGFDPCMDGTAPASGTQCTSGNYFLGTLGAFRYMTTPGGCTNSATPTCSNSTDSVSKIYGAYNVSQGTDLSNGASNTNLLVTNDGTAAAAIYCSNLVYGGYSDWFLPATNELSLLWNALSASHRLSIGVASSAYYTSSSELDATDARLRLSSDGSEAQGQKSSEFLVRCMRRY